jgi:hypothetical protein
MPRVYTSPGPQCVRNELDVKTRKGLLCGCRTVDPLRRIRSSLREAEGRDCIDASRESF